jgi:AAA+ ATPase superfamily predicted ATPase
MPFHNRELELSSIDQILASRRSELIIVYGRRGAGKSALLAEALRNRPHLYYQATIRAVSQQLEDLTAALRTYAPGLIVAGALPSFEEFLEALAGIAIARPDQPSIIVVDELPYLAQADPAIPTVIQLWWDGIRRRDVRNLKVFLLGSQVSWMEENTLTGRAPLHNRRTGQLKIDPLGYAEAALFYPAYSADERLAAYAIWGGLPSYVEEIDPERTLWENVREGVLRPSARLADEPTWLRFTDLRDDALYSSILRAIAEGNHRPSMIARAVGRERAEDVIYALDRLADLRLVQRVVPIHQIHQARSRQALYLLSDQYVAFWYRFVDRLRHLTGLNRLDEAIESIRSTFDHYVSETAFEAICRQYVWRARAHGFFPSELALDTVGSWWAASQEVQDQIDVVATDRGRTVLVGECKWSRQPIDSRDLDGLLAALRKAGSDLNPIDRPWRALFSRSGFTDDLRDMAAEPGSRLLLVTPEDLYR